MYMANITPLIIQYLLNNSGDTKYQISLILWCNDINFVSMSHASKCNGISKFFDANIQYNNTNFIITVKQEMLIEFNVCLLNKIYFIGK